MFKKLRFIEFIAFSLALHLLFLAGMWLKKLETKRNAITVEILEHPPVAQNPALRPVEKKKKTETKTPAERQIVQQEEKKTNEEAPDTRFLSAQNQKVKKQTVAKKKGEFRNSKKEAASPHSSPAKTWSLAPKLDASSLLADEGLRKKEKQTEPQNNDTNDKKAAQADGSQTDDYVKGVDQGLETLLNAREFKYYTYYNRIRRQLSQYWEPNVRVKLTRMFKQGRYIASDTDRITKLIVVLDRKGNLVKVQVLKNSGVTDLDDAATEAFQSAAPFPNPPPGIVDPDGTVKIRWDFVLEG